MRGSPAGCIRQSQGGKTALCRVLRAPCEYAGGGDGDYMRAVGYSGECVSSRALVRVQEHSGVARKGVHGAERHPYRVSRERVAVGSRLCLAPRRLEVGLAQGREGEAAKVALCQRLRLARVDAPNEGGDDRGGARLPGPLHAHKGARQPEAVAARQAEGEGEEDEVERDEHECFGQAAAEADTRLGKRVELERPAARLRPQQGTLRLSAQQRQRLRRRRGELPQLRASR
mmetsp:Transcript_17848/g.56327  ORF Transcript_17848/g.56327 Transcript_17848/m.56327 type:complete len:230 (-) Transcript_17848:895-1584(-)